MGRPSTCDAEPFSHRRKYVTVPGYAGHVSQIRWGHSQTFKQTAVRAFTVAEQKLNGPGPDSLVPYLPNDMYAVGPNPRRKTNVRNFSSLPFGDPRHRPMVSTNAGMTLVPQPPVQQRGVLPGWEDMSKEDRKHAYAKALRYIGGLERVTPLIEALRHKILCRIGGHGALSRMFSFFDLDNSGSIDVDEFCHATSQIFQLDFSDAQVVALFAVYDDDLGGSISYYEFIEKVMADRFDPAELQNTVQKLLTQKDKVQTSYDVLEPFIEGGFLKKPANEVYNSKRIRSTLDQATHAMCAQVHDKLKDVYTCLVPYEKFEELMTHLEAADCPDPEEVVCGYEAGDSFSWEQFWTWWRAYVVKFHQNRHGDDRIGPDAFAAHREFRQLDRNGDGAISHAEFVSASGKGGAHEFDKVDADGDGQLSKEEYMAAYGKRDRMASVSAAEHEFELLDRNGDGATSRAEFVSAFGKDSVHEFDKVDADGNGQLSKEEYMAAYGKNGRMAPVSAAQRKFELLDTDGDGAISRAEFVSAFGKDSAHEFDKVDADGNGQLSKEEYMAAYGKSGRMASASAAQREFGQLDRNGDGAISRAEFVSAFGKGGAHEFDKVDADGNGQLSKEEYMAAYSLASQPRGQANAHSNALVRGSAGDWHAADVTPRGSLLRHSRPMPPEVMSNRPALSSSRAIGSRPQTGRPENKHTSHPMSNRYVSYAQIQSGRSRLPAPLPSSDVGFVAKFRGNTTARGYASHDRHATPRSDNRPVTAPFNGTVPIFGLKNVPRLPLSRPRPDTSRGCTTGYRM